MVWESSPATAGLWIAALGISSLLPLGGAWAGKAIVDAVVASRAREALTWVIVELVIIASLGAVARAASVLRSLLGVRLGLSLNLRILRKALTLELKHFQDAEIYDQLTRARREASSRPLALAGELLNLIGAAITLLGFVGLLFRFSPLAVGGLLLAAFPAALAELRFSRTAFDLRNQRATDARRLSYLEYVLASDEHAKEVMMLGLGPTLLSRYEEIGARIWRDERSLTLRRTFWVTLLSQLGTLSFYGCYLFIVWRAATGKLGIGDMALYAVSFRQAQQSFQSILLSLGSMVEHELYMSNLLGFLDLPAASGPRPLLLGAAREERGVRFEGVSFQYPGQAGFALRDINLMIPAGKSLALVGHNGAGKTTFIKLLTGLYEPTEGRVLLDGKDLRAMPAEEVRRRIAVVFQDFNQYQMTARENVGYGSPEHIGEDAQIARAAERGGAREVVAALAAGINTQLGRWFPGGVDLSGGQWQRVALSRAFMRESADVLVLDEPTAALDVDAEVEVFERVRQTASGRTLLLISHRFANVRMVDHIVVLEKSGVVEEGNHDELMARGGLYAAMFRKQAKGYA